MKSRYPSVLVFLVLLTHGALAQTEDEARKLVQQTLKDLHSHKVAMVWESFSDASKDHFRKVFIEHVQAIEKIDVPREKPAEKSKWVAMVKEEEEKFYNPDGGKYTWAESTLRLEGFIDGLDKVRSLDNGEFWSVFLDNKYLTDRKDQDSFKQITVLSPKYEPVTPPYQIDGVAFSGDRFFVVMSAPADAKEALFSGLYPAGKVYFNPMRKDREPMPSTSFVWSGVKENGRLKLNVPDVVVSRLAIQTYSMTHPTR